MKSQNYRKLIRKASRWAPCVVMAAAILVTAGHSIIIASPIASAKTQIQELQNKFHTNDDVDKNLEQAVKDANYKYNSAKERGEDLVKLEKLYAGYQQKADEAVSDDEKKKNETARDEIAGKMKSYFDSIDQTNVMLWYAGDPDSSHWKFSTVYDFPDNDASEPVVFICSDKSSKLWSFMTASFDRDRGTFSDVSLYTTYAGQERIPDNDGNYIYVGAWNGAPDLSAGDSNVNFASVPAVLWDTLIVKGQLYPLYTDVYADADKQVRDQQKAQREASRKAAEEAARREAVEEASSDSESVISDSEETETDVSNIQEESDTDSLSDESVSSDSETQADHAETAESEKEQPEITEIPLDNAGEGAE